MLIHHSPTTLYLLAMYNHKGQTQAQPPDEVVFSLVSQSDDWAYLTNHRLILLLDDTTRLDMGELVRRGEVGRAGRVQESMFVQLPRATFEKIARAAKVEAQLASTEFALKPEHIGALRDLLSRF
jgi:hypothetical protein